MHLLSVFYENCNYGEADWIYKLHDLNHSTELRYISHEDNVSGRVTCPTSLEITSGGEDTTLHTLGVWLHAQEDRWKHMSLNKWKFIQQQKRFHKLRG